MAQKKDRSRFTIKFRQNDPAHDMTIRILENQGQRNIAPFLVTAVLHYVQCTETPDMSHMLAEKPQPVLDRNAIEEIVWGILWQQGMINCDGKSDIKVKSEKNLSEIEKDMDKAQDVFLKNISPQKTVKDETREMIVKALSAFRND